MKKSIGKQVERETKMLDVAVKSLKEMAKIAFKKGSDAESTTRSVENGSDNEPVGDAKSKLELKKRSQSSIVVLIQQQDTKWDCGPSIGGGVVYYPVEKRRDARRCSRMVNACLRLFRGKGFKSGLNSLRHVKKSGQWFVLILIDSDRGMGIIK
jgi:hypothetical protein